MRSTSPRSCSRRDDWTATSARRTRGRGVGSGLAARQRRLRGRSLRRRARHAPDLHPPCERREASDRSPRPHVDRYGEATTAAEMRVVCQKLRKAIEDEGRLARIEGLWWQFSLTERSPREPSAVSLLRISRDRDGRAGGRRPLVAGGRQSVREILERGGEGEEGAFGCLLLLEGRTAPGPERAAAGRDRGDPAGVCRSRGRLLHDACGRDPERECANVRRLPARRSRGHEHPGRKRRAATRAELIADRLKHWKSIRA